VAGQKVEIVRLETGGRLADALAVSLATLDDLGRLNPIDEAQVATVRVLADALDHDAGNAALWGQFRSAWLELRGIDDADADELGRLAAEMRAAVVDPQDS